MSRPLWFVRLLKKSFPGRFLLARATRAPLVGQLVDRWLFENDELIYLPKDHTIPIRQSIDRPPETVLPSQVVEHFIHVASAHWVMDTCICREAAGCEDYPVDLGCLFLGQATLDIHPRLGRPVTRGEALEHLVRCREAGLVHLVGRNKLDTVWLGVAPGDKLLTICHCCPCCCLWRVLPHIAPQIGAKVRRMPGAKVIVSQRCIGCGVCVAEGCFVDALHLVDGRAVVDETCRGCGRCVDRCPHGAIEICVTNRDFVAQSIAQIARLVDVS